MTLGDVSPSAPSGTTHHLAFFFGFSLPALLFVLSTVLSSTVLETTSFPEAAVKGVIYRRQCVIYRRQCSPGNRHPEPNPRQEIQLAGLRDSGRRC